MPFLTPDELKDAIYQYQLEDITEGDQTIVEDAIDAAIDEVRSYLTPNNQLENYDGRVLYDTQATFAATGENRNPLILAHVKTVTLWWIVLLSNTDMIYEKVKDRYDRSVAYLTKVAKGQVTIATLPVYKQPTTDPEGNPVQQPDSFSFGSRPKFSHDVGPWNDESSFF